MDCDWITVSQDRSREEVTLTEPNLPELGDGKIRAGKGFEVVLVVTTGNMSARVYFGPAGFGPSKGPAFSGSGPSSIEPGRFSASMFSISSIISTC